LRLAGFLLVGLVSFFLVCGKRAVCLLGFLYFEFLIVFVDFFGWGFGGLWLGFFFVIVLGACVWDVRRFFLYG